ncbi:MAG: hypothetical protein AB7F08_06735 [Dongiaceae bacterium]
MSATPPRGPNASGAAAFLPLAGEALKTIWRERNAVLLLAILPAIGSFLLEIAMVATGLLTLIDPAAGRMPTFGEFMTMLMIFCINLAFVTIFSVAWTRRLLIGPADGLGLRWGRRELGYLARLVGIMLTVVLASFLVSLALALVGLGLLATPAGINFVTAAGLALAIFVYVRAMLILPAAAIDRPLGVAQALEATRGARSIWIGVALVLVILPFLLLFFAVALVLSASGLSAAAPYASLFIQAMLGYAMQATIIALHTLAYRQLIGGARGPTTAPA